MLLFLGGVLLALRKDTVLSLLLLCFIPALFVVVVLIGRRIDPLGVENKQGQGGHGPHMDVGPDDVLRHHPGGIGQALLLVGLLVEGPEVFRRDIDLEHVTFRYDDADEPAVSDVTIHIRAGQKVSVIGGTGSGKSTLVQLQLSSKR